MAYPVGNGAVVPRRRMTDLELLAAQDTGQPHRFVRFRVAALSSLLVLCLLAVLALDGYIEDRGFLYAAGGILACLVFFYVLFRSGLNLRASDPSLTVPQIISAIAVLTVAMYYTADDARDVILPAVLMAFVFGVFRLGTRQLIGVACMAIACYVMMIALLLQFRPDDIAVRLEVSRLLIFSPILMWFALVGGYIGRLRKELSDSKARVEELLLEDALTAAPNRRHLRKAPLQEKARCDRSQQTFCLAIFDLDFFKRINDEFGHKAGDEVLKSFAQCGIRAVRAVDTFGRYGGEEFEAVMVGVSLDGAEIAAERIRRAVEALRFPHIDPNLKITVSVGIAQYRPGETTEDTERRADAALYRAKAAGRNRVERESSLATDGRHRA